jgi:hypothetical protein
VIVIEGAPSKRVEVAARETLAKVGLSPGEILRIPALEQARDAMTKASPAGTAVEVLPIPKPHGAADLEHTDILVRFGTVELNR